MDFLDGSMFLSFFYNKLVLFHKIYKVGVKNWACYLAFHRKELLSKGQ